MPSSRPEKFVTMVLPPEPAPTGHLKDDVDTSLSKEHSSPKVFSPAKRCYEAMMKSKMG
jgi:hypothetical protein